MNKRCLITIMSVFSQVIVASEAMAPPSFMFLPAEKENSVLSMECESIDSLASLKCNFTQVSVRYEGGDAAEKELEQAIKEKPSEALKSLKQICGSDGKPKNVDLKVAGTAEKKLVQRIAKDAVTELCRTKTASEAYAALKKIISTAKECKIHVNTFSKRFERLGPLKWLSNPGPEGICNHVTVTTLEKTGPSSQDWEYTQTRVDADKSGELCKALELNQPYRFSNKNESQFLIECNTYKFSLF